MKTIKKLWAWIVYSSSDTTKISLTIRGFLGGLITLATIWAGLAGITLPNATLTQLVDSIVAIVQSVAVVVTGIMTLWGLGRKIWSTMSGTNDVVNNNAAFAPELG